MLKFLYLILFFLAACGGGYNPDLELDRRIPDSNQVGLYKAERLNPLDPLRFESGVLSGTGAVRLSDALIRAYSANHYRLTFRLEASGVLQLTTHAQKDLSRGVELKFYRDGESTQLQVEATVLKVTSNLTAHFQNFDASRELAVSFDIHNDHPNVELIFWDGDASSEVAPFLRKTLLGRGQLNQWGATLVRSELRSLERSSPRHRH